MLNLTPPDYKFCPFCGKPLQIKVQEGKNWKYCPDDKWTYYPRVTQSAVAVIKKDGKVLLVKRAREPFLGLWMFPAGYISYGEHPEDNLKREVFEETGLKVKSLKFLEVVQSTDDKRELGHLVFFYEAEVESGEVSMKGDPEENLAIDWFEIQKVPRLAWECHRNVLKKLQNHGY